MSLDELVQLLRPEVIDSAFSFAAGFLLGHYSTSRLDIIEIEKKSDEPRKKLYAISGKDCSDLEQLDKERKMTIKQWYSSVILFSGLSGIFSGHAFFCLDTVIRKNNHRVGKYSVLSAAFGFFGAMLGSYIGKQSIKAKCERITCKLDEYVEEAKGFFKDGEYDKERIDAVYKQVAKAAAESRFSGLYERYFLIKLRSYELEQNNSLAAETKRKIST